MLSELIEEYKETEDVEQKKLLIKEFTNMLWKSKYTFKTYKKYYTYKVSEKALLHRQDLIDLFDTYKNLEFTFCKSFYKNKMNSIDYIRIHVNNMYGYITNKNVYLSKEYYKLLLTPKHEYYKTIDKLKRGEDIDCNEIRNTIEQALKLAEKIKQESLNKKINIKWTEYKRLVNKYIERLFENYIPPHEYEQKYGWEMNVNIDGWNEDNYVIKYFCKSLTGYLRNYVKSIKPKLCKNCNNEIKKGRNNSYCEQCKNKLNKINKKIWDDKLVKIENLIEYNTNKYGSKMKIINYKNKHNVTVKFENGYIKYNVKYNNFIKGNVTSPFDKRVYGAGFIGEGKYKSSVEGNKTKQYTTWFSMMNRCYSEKYIKREKSYKDVFVYEEWHNFQNFAKWYDENYYEVEGEVMCLDKDVLKIDNKVYSPETCIFLPKSINNIFISGKSKRGNLPIGVKYYKKEKRYYVYCGNGSNGKIYGGSYIDIESAFNGYKKTKENLIKEKANEYKDRLPKKVYDALINYKVKIDD